MTPHARLNTAVLGTGPLGLDLIDRIHASPYLNSPLVVGHRPGSRGLAQAAGLGCVTRSGGIDAVLDADRSVDIVFDATNAFAHPAHWDKLADTGAILIDLTPTTTGTLIVPTVNGHRAAEHQHIGLVSCSGQAALPILHAVTSRYPAAAVEMVATAASASVGRASRLNLDEYLDTTQQAIRDFTHAPDAKTMINISAATPAPPFRVAITVITADPAPADDITTLTASVEQKMRALVPGYRVTSCTSEDRTVRVVVEVTATRSRIPVHAGNLEVISAAAIHAAEQRARHQEAHS
ncbi:acetylating acetaldehyde dehydrogenase [Streptomyces violaceoruber]|uniref:acetylating acetaldehyde dehydrogenase n=1 Tax=Streptomyces violaceoruber TaxID=1935 RepID=UPI00403C5F21